MKDQSNLLEQKESMHTTGEIKVYDYSFYELNGNLKKGMILAKGIREAKAYLKEKYGIECPRKQRIMVGWPKDIEIADIHGSSF